MNTEEPYSFDSESEWKRKSLIPLTVSQCGSESGRALIHNYLPVGLMLSLQSLHGLSEALFKTELQGKEKLEIERVYEGIFGVRHPRESHLWTLNANENFRKMWDCTRKTDLADYK